MIGSTQLVTFFACPLIMKKDFSRKELFPLETTELRSLIERYKTELMQTAARSPFAENTVGTPISPPEDTDAVVNLPEAPPDRDPLQEFSPVSDTFESFRQRNTKSGFLRIQAFAGPQTIPVPGADVLVTRNFLDGTRRFAAGTTDSSGVLDGIILPAPDSTLSQQPGTVLPYALYDVRVSHPDYRTEVYRDVPVFDGIKSIQPVRFQSEV